MTNATRLAPQHMTRRASLGLLGTVAAGIALPSRRALASHDLQAQAEPATSFHTAQQGAGFYRFKVGEMDCAVIGDTQFPAAAHPTFGNDRTAEEVQALLDRECLPTEQVLIHVNVLLIKAGRETILVDSGNGGQAAKLVGTLATLGLKPTDITGIVISHLHPDHFGGLTDAAGQPVFSQAQYFINRQEADFWSGPNPDLSKSKLPPDWQTGMVKGASGALKLMQGRLNKLGDGDTVVEGLTVHAAYGHTPGHQMLHIASGKDQVLMIADAAHHFQVSLRQPDWKVLFDLDQQQAAETRRKVFDRAAADRVQIATYHFPFPGLGHIRRDGDGYEWLPTPWSW